MCKVIGVVSLKGGVGKTTSVVALGHAFSERGKRVLLIDGNLSAPNLGMHLNIFSPKKSLQDVLMRKINSHEAIHELDNFDLIPASLFCDSEIEHLSLKNRISNLKEKYDVIIIDSSPRLDDETLAVMLASDEVVVVTTPDLPTLGTTIKAVNLANKRGTSIGGLILNKVYNKNFEVSFEDIQNTSEVPILAVIPHDFNFSKAVSEFKSYAELKPNSPASEEYRKLAAVLVGEKYKKHKLNNFFRWINPKKQDINRVIYYDSLFRD